MDNKKIILCIDPGKGGNETGVVNNKLVEKELNLHLALSLLKEVQCEKIHPFLTRSADYFVSLKKRIEMAHDLGASVFISIQMSQSKNVCDRGVRAIFYSQESKSLADCLLKKINKNLPDLHQRGLAEGRLPIFQLKIPAVIIECGCLTNYQDSEIFNDPLNHVLFAWSIRQGIDEYLKRGKHYAN